MLIRRRALVILALGTLAVGLAVAPDAGARSARHRPAITSLSPARAGTRGHTPILVTGTGFHAVRSVSVGGDPASSYEVLSGHSMLVWTPQRSAGRARVTVHTAAGRTASRHAELLFVRAAKPGDWRTASTPMPHGVESPDPDAQDDATLSEFTTECASVKLCYQTGMFDRGPGTEDFASVLVTRSGSTTRSRITPTDPAGLDSDLFAISCGSPKWCLGVGAEYGTSDALVVTIVDGTATAGKVAPHAGFDSLRLFDVACPAAEHCFATGAEYRTAGAHPVPVFVTIDGATTTISTVSRRLTQLDCPTTSWCAAVAGGWSTGRYVAVFDHGGWKTRPLPTPAAANPQRSSWTANQLSCPAPNECTAMGKARRDVAPHDTRVAIWTLRGTSWTVRNLPIPLQERNVFGFPITSLSCPAVRRCVGVGTWVTSLIVRQVGDRFTEQLAPVPSGYGEKQRYAELSSVSCPSVTHCDAVGQFGNLGLDEVWSNGVWTGKVISKGKEPKDSQFMPNSVSCPAAAHCLTSGLLFTNYDEDEGWSYVQEVYAVK